MHPTAAAGTIMAEEEAEPELMGGSSDEEPEPEMVDGDESEETEPEPALVRGDTTDSDSEVEGQRSDKGESNLAGRQQAGLDPSGSREARIQWWRDKARRDVADQAAVAAAAVTEDSWDRGRGSPSSDLPSPASITPSTGSPGIDPEWAQADAEIRSEFLELQDLVKRMRSDSIDGEQVLASQSAPSLATPGVARSVQDIATAISAAVDTSPPGARP